MSWFTGEEKKTERGRTQRKAADQEEPLAQDSLCCTQRLSCKTDFAKQVVVERSGLITGIRFTDSRSS